MVIAGHLKSIGHKGRASSILAASTKKITTSFFTISSHSLHSFALNAPQGSVDKTYMKQTKFLFLLGFLISIEGFSQSCQAPQKGWWTDLYSLNQIEFNSKCEFKFKGANCAVSGDFLSSSRKEGVLNLLTKSPSANSSCPSKGEKSCGFKIHKNTLTLHCSPDKPIVFVRPVNRKLASKGRSSEIDLLLFYLQSENAGQMRKQLETLSRKGMTEATAALGFNYFHGSRGFKRNYTEALYWNRLAAVRGSDPSKTLVGIQYLYGLGTPKDFSKAEEFFLMGAEKDEVVPQKALAGMYLMEEESSPNREKAIHWLVRASRLGDDQARTFLANLKPDQMRTLRNLCSLLPIEAPALPPKPTRDSAALETIDSVLSNREKVEMKKYDSLFQVRPYFLAQERQSSSAALSIGLTPGVTLGDWTLRGHLMLSGMNLLYSSRFVGLETSVMGAYQFGKDFVELGGGVEFWPAPSGTAPTLSLGYGREVQLEAIGFDVKRISVGLSETFFSDKTYKFFVGFYF